MQPPLRIAVLCSDGPSDAALVAALSARWALVAVVVEPRGAQIRRLRQRGRWADWGWAMYHAWRLRLTGMDRRRAALFADMNTAPAAPAQVQRVGSINGGDAAALLEAQRADVTIVRGTSILGAR